LNKPDTLIKQLDLVPHPEGGFYKELYRSPLKVSCQTLATERSAYTSIYYLLNGNDFSAWHRITSDETWFFHAGTDLCIYTLADDGVIKPHVIGPSDAALGFQTTVPANTWFAAQVLDKNSYCLVSCIVGPGFEFTDFELGSREALCALIKPGSKDVKLIQALTRQ
jgi:hypothetical protein